MTVAVGRVLPEVVAAVDVFGCRQALTAANERCLCRPVAVLSGKLIAIGKGKRPLYLSFITSWRELLLVQV